MPFSISPFLIKAVLRVCPIIDEIYAIKVFNTKTYEPAALAKTLLSMFLMISVDPIAAVRVAR